VKEDFGGDRTIMVPGAADLLDARESV
jgi:hypothetical protein